MRKYLILPAALALLVAPGTAQATTTLDTTCATTTLQYWTTNATHNGHDIQQRMQPHGDSVFGDWETIAQQSDHLHTYYAKRPQAQKVEYRVVLTQNGVPVAGESDTDETCDLTSTIDFAAGAEYDDCYVSDFWDPTDVAECGGTSSNDDDGEWAQQDYDLGGFGSNVETSNPTALKGVRSYVCNAQTDPDPDTNDRCEYAMGNADAANISTNAIWGNNQEVWYALAFRLDGTPACRDSSGDYDCGAISQEKQLGMCGKPINSMAVESSVTGQLYLAQHNDEDTDCDANRDGWTLWREPISTNTWIRVLRHYKFSADPNVGYVESYIDADGDAFIDWNPVNVLAADGQALDDTLVSAPADIGTVNTVNGSNQSRRVETWTLKDDPSTSANGTYCPSATTTPSGNKWPCAHARIGIYRSGAITGTTTVNHDSVTSGSDSGDVVDVAF